ncbi:MAG TPA: ABC transporter permease [Flavobacteriales bacterium]
MNEKLEVRVYSAKNRQEGFSALLKDMFRDLSKSMDLGYRLAKRDIQGMYRQSLLGIFWAFITPLLTSVIWIFLNATGVIKTGQTNIPYPAYVFAGTILWSIFTEGIMSPINQTQQSKAVMSKINFPKEGLLLAAFYKLAFNSAIKLVLLIAFFLFMGVYPTATVVFVPFLMLGLMVFGFVIGMFLTPLTLLFGDVGRAIPLALQLFMFLTPVVYIMPAGGVLLQIMKLNPVTPMIMSVRNFLSGYEFYMPGYFAVVMLATLALSLVAWIIYRMSIPIIVER